MRKSTFFIEFYFIYLILVILYSGLLSLLPASRVTVVPAFQAVLPASQVLVPAFQAVLPASRVTVVPASQAAVPAPLLH